MNFFNNPATNASIHPECPDFRMLGPTDQDAAVRALADANDADAQGRDEAWSKGFTRRRLLAGGMGVGVAAVASQLVTTRVAYGAPGTGGGNTVVVVFLRGGLDGLSVLVPGGDKALAKLRPQIGLGEESLIRFGGSRQFGLHPSLGALKPMLNAGKIAAVPDISTPNLSRSHFQAQDCLERGGNAGTGSQGWLDRVLELTGTGTTFRSMSVTSNLTRSLSGTSSSLVGRDPGAMRLPTGDDAKLTARTRKALDTLYTGVDHPYALQTALALEVSTNAKKLEAKAGAKDDSRFPAGGFGEDLRMVSALIKSNVGLRVATVDLGGWDMHTGIGNVDQGDMTKNLKEVGDGLAAFFKDLGAAGEKTTVVLMSEFGRRAEQNASGGADHGHGGLAMVMGGGVRGGVYGEWKGLRAENLDQGDLPGSNDFRDFLGEIVMSRFGLGAGDLRKVFPGWKINKKGLMVGA